MKFEKPTIHMEINGCKVNGFIIGQPHELRLMLSVIAKFATKRLSVGEIIEPFWQAWLRQRIKSVVHMNATMIRPLRI